MTYFDFKLWLEVHIVWLNPNYALSRLLEKCGVGDYLKRTEFAAHLFAGGFFALMGVVWGWWIPAIWFAWTIIDEFIVDGWKGRDTLIDLASKLAGPVGYMIWTLVR